MIIFFLGVTFLAIVIHLLLDRQPKTAHKIIEITLLYLLTINFGLGGLLAFYGHAFMADEVARSIGWAPGSPFQYEMAIANLSFGILGFLCFWLRGNFWLAVGIAELTFGWGAAVGHLREMVLKGNFSVNNAGLVLWVGDIGLPLLVFVLLIIHRRLEQGNA